MKMYTIAIDMSLKVHVPVRAADEDEAMDLFDDMDRLKMVDWQKYDVFIEPVDSEIVKVSSDLQEAHELLHIKIWGKDISSNIEANNKFRTWQQAFEFFGLGNIVPYTGAAYEIAVPLFVNNHRLNMEILYNED